jgi:cysteinyl-tRNA synthetase
MKKHWGFIFLSCALAALWSCRNNTGDENVNFKQEMRTLVQAISTYTKGIDSTFAIIPQNGQEILTVNGEAGGNPDLTYIRAIDGVGREDVFYGYGADNVATATANRDYLLGFMDIARDNGVKVLVTDYCSTPAFMDDSYTQNHGRGYISFSAGHRELDNIPAYPAQPYAVNDSNITSLAQANNFLYMINPGSFSGKDAFLTAIRATNYDVVLIDLYYQDVALTAAEVASLKTKANGGQRLLICYVSIGEAENYRYYWQSSWEPGSPAWVAAENPEWAGNFKVRYWDPAWKDIIFGNDASYLKKVLDAGFNGVYLDIIDAFEFFDSLNES